MHGSPYDYRDDPGPPAGWTAPPVSANPARDLWRATDGPGCVDWTLARRWAARLHATRAYGWALIDDDALDAIARRGPILEIGAGRGYLAALLRLRGTDVIALADGYEQSDDDEHPREKRARADGVARGLQLALRLFARAQRVAALDIEPRPTEEGG